MNYDFLYQYIPVGIENAIHQQDLASKLNKTPAATKYAIRQARLQGLQILSGNEGYWFAADESEKQAFVKLMRKQAFSRLKTTTPIKNTLTGIKGQLSLTESLEGAFDEVAEDEK